MLVSDTVIADNEMRAVSASGHATVQGGGLLNDGLLHLRDVLVTENDGTAIGPAGFAQGGGIWNGSLFNEPPIELTLEATTVTRNRLRASLDLAVQGGGLSTTVPVTFIDGRIAHNSPDQCYGC
jgi:hypothetical protein